MQASRNRSQAPRRVNARWFVPMLLFGVACTGSVIEQDTEADPGNGAPGPSGTAGSPSAGPGPSAGSTSGPGPGAGAGAGAKVDCETPSPGSAPLRRLSNAEYVNTVTDLFSSIDGFAETVAQATADFPQETESLGFRNNAELLTVQPLLAQKYMDAAELIAERAARATQLLPCTPERGSEVECARQFIREFGQRAFRRALTAEEEARFVAQFEQALSEYDFATGVEWFVFTVLQSPSFLYRVETGERVAGAELARPTGHEMATRLSYLFWQSLPDEELLRAADAGELATPEGVEREARRLLADPRSERLFQYFAEWLDLDRLTEFSRDPALFPDLPRNLPALLQEETRAFVSALLTRKDGSFGELFTAPYTYANDALARHYGLSSVSSKSFVRVDAPHASGVLTQGMLLVQDKPYRTSIVRRGLKVRTDLLCQNVPAPPDDVVLNLEAIGGGLSQRERLEQHRSDPSCAGCHALLDPIGVVFESFDAVGRYRTEDEDGKPIVTASTISATRDANGPVEDVRELGALLAASSEARECYVTQTFRFFFGRDVEPADACTISRLNTTFVEKGESLSELLIALTQTDAFLYRPLNTEVSP